MWVNRINKESSACFLGINYSSMIENKVGTNISISWTKIHGEDAGYSYQVRKNYLGLYENGLRIFKGISKTKKNTPKHRELPMKIFCFVFSVELERDIFATNNFFVSVRIEVQVNSIKRGWTSEIIWILKITCCFKNNNELCAVKRGILEFDPTNEEFIIWPIQHLQYYDSRSRYRILRNYLFLAQCVFDLHVRTSFTLLQGSNDRSRIQNCTRFRK